MMVGYLRTALFAAAICILLAGCSLSADDEIIGSSGGGFFTGTADQGQNLLIGNTYYKVTKDTKIQNDKGRDLKVEDLTMGMRVKTWYAGTVTESFPAKAEARLIQVLTDQESKRQSRAAEAAVDYLKKAESQMFMVLKCSCEGPDSYTFEIMSRSNQDESYMITVDSGTYKILH